MNRAVNDTDITRISRPRVHTLFHIIKEVTQSG